MAKFRKGDIVLVYGKWVAVVMKAPTTGKRFYQVLSIQHLQTPGNWKYIHESDLSPIYTHAAAEAGADASISALQPITIGEEIIDLQQIQKWAAEATWPLSARELLHPGA